MAIPKPTAERLSQLARLLSQRGKLNPISSAEIEQMTGWTSHTIRKDISSLEAGSDIATSTGYDPERLAQAIRLSLNLTDSATKCCIVGLGKLGSAFLEYAGFSNSPFTLCTGFDSNVNRIEILKADFPLYPTFKMKEIIPRLGISLAILSVPPEKAQETTDRLIDCGIIGIANFTSAILSVPSEIEIENISLLDALSSLSARLAAKTNHLRREK